MKKGVNVWGLIAVLIAVGLLFVGIVSTEVIAADVNKDIAATNVNVTPTSPKGDLELVRGDYETDTSTKNKTEWIKVTPTSTHDMVVTNVNTTPSSPDLEQPTVIHVTVTNEGEQQEDNVSVKVYVDSAQIGSTQYISLAPGLSNTTSFLWTPTTAKAYSVKGEVGIVNGEIDVKDNTKRVRVRVSAVPTPTPTQVPQDTGSHSKDNTISDEGYGVVPAEDVSGGLKLSVGDVDLFDNKLSATTYVSQAAVNYAIDYAYKACGCGKYYGSSPPPQGSGTQLTTNGGDCAHFVSHCLAAGGLSNKGTGYARGWCEGGTHDYIITAHEMRDWFTDTGIATKVSSVNQLEPGDIIVTNSYGHVVLYIGNYGGKTHQVASHSAWGIFSYTYFGTPNEYWHITSSSLTDQQKQQEILNLVNGHRGSLPAELILALIRSEGGEGAFHVDGWNYNAFYRESDGPWAQPTNGDGIMQVTTASGYHERSGPYTHDGVGYDHAINDGCDYILALYNTYGTHVQSTLHYNTGPNSLALW